MVFITHSGFNTETYICVLMSVEKSSVHFIWFCSQCEKKIIYTFLYTKILKSEHICHSFMVIK